jgi:hypothetical protein
VAATVQQSGAGVLNLAAAVSGTVAAYPTSLDFGTGADTINSTLQLTLWNVGSSGDTFTIQAVPTGNSPGLSISGALSATSIQLGANGSQQIPVTLSASGLVPGEYQGYLTVQGTTSSNTATVPYWFAVPGSTPAGVSVIYQDFVDPMRTVSRQAVVFRVVDAAGLPYTGTETPQTAITSGTGSIRSSYRIGDIPGTYAMDIRTGTTSMEVSISIAGSTTSVVIPVI